MEKFLYILSSGALCATDGCIVAAVVVLFSAGASKYLVGVFIGLGHVIVGTAGLLLASLLAGYAVFPHLIAGLGYIAFAVFHTHIKTSEKQGQGLISLLGLSLLLSVDSSPWGAYAHRFGTSHCSVEAASGGFGESFLAILAAGVIVGGLTYFAVLCGDKLLKSLQRFGIGSFGPKGKLAVRAFGVWLISMFAFRSLWDALGSVAHFFAAKSTHLEFLLRSQSPPGWLWMSVAGGILGIVFSVWYFRKEKVSHTHCACCATSHEH